MSFSAAALRVLLQAQLPVQATGLLVGLSGGADSSCLLAAAALVGRAGTLPLRAVHIDHGLQPAGADFRRNCAALAGSLDVPLTIVQVAVVADGVSIEAAARDARYAALAAQLRSGECLLTAHHREDQAETVLLQALRGGFKGLSGMPQCRPFGAGWHLRPLLQVTRSELREFGAALGIEPAADPMNADPRFDRVYLRRSVWPLLEQKWPGAGLALSRVARHVAAAQEILDATAAADLARLRDGDALTVSGMRALPRLRQINVLRHWLAAAAAVPPPEARLQEALRQLLQAGGDHQPAIIWSRNALRRYRDRIFLTAAAVPCLDAVHAWSVGPPAALDLGAGLGRLHLVPRRGGLAAAKLPPVLLVRGRHGGERLKPGARAATRSVQHLCQSLGVLPWMRGALPCVFAGGDLIAVADLWLDARWCAPAGEPGLGCEWRDAPDVV